MKQEEYDGAKKELLEIAVSLDKEFEEAENLVSACAKESDEYSEEELKEAYVSAFVEALEEPGDVVAFHVTSIDNADEILENGIHAHENTFDEDDEDSNPVIWTAQSLEDAREWAEVIAEEKEDGLQKYNHSSEYDYSKFVIFKIDAEHVSHYSIKSDRDDAPPKEIIIEEKHIPPEDISKVEEYSPDMTQ